MSLAIEVRDVVKVLLTDGWHAVESGSFSLDSYEYLDGDVTLHGGGQSGITATGFVFTDRDEEAVTFGPLTAILAVKVRA